MRFIISEKIANEIIKLSFTHVKNLYRSLFVWLNFDFPIVDSNNLSRNKIHAYS